jgi:hypothetical protein
MYSKAKYWRWGLIFLLLGFSQLALANIRFAEVMWMGTDLSTADEWIELYSEIETDISGWSLSKLNNSGSGHEVLLTFATGTVLLADEVHYNTLGAKVVADKYFNSVNLNLER